MRMLLFHVLFDLKINNISNVDYIIEDDILNHRYELNDLLDKAESNLMEVIKLRRTSEFMTLAEAADTVFDKINSYVGKDQEIIGEAGLADYPKYYSFTKRKIVKKLEENPYIEEVTIKRSFFHVIKIFCFKFILHQKQKEVQNERNFQQKRKKRFI